MGCHAVPPVGEAGVPSATEDLKRVVAQLHKWANDSVVGGWSTHQVGPMRDLAADLSVNILRRDVLGFAAMCCIQCKTPLDAQLKDEHRTGLCVDCQRKAGGHV